MMENDYVIKLSLSKREVAELLRFFFHCGWIERNDGYEVVQDFLWRLKVEMDILYPSWEPRDLDEICKGMEQ